MNWRHRGFLEGPLGMGTALNLFGGNLYIQKRGAKKWAARILPKRGCPRGGITEGENSHRENASETGGGTEQTKGRASVVSFFLSLL